MTDCRTSRARSGEPRRFPHKVVGSMASPAASDGLPRSFAGSPVAPRCRSSVWRRPGPGTRADEEGRGEQPAQGEGAIIGWTMPWTMPIDGVVPRRGGLDRDLALWPEVEDASKASP